MIPHDASLSIASVNFILSCADHPILDPPSASYDPFAGVRADGPDAIDVSVRLELGGAPDARELTPVFDTGLSWSLSRDGDSCYFSLDSPTGAGEPLWVAEVASDFTRVTVHCGRELLTEGGAALINPIRYPLDQLLVMYVLSRHGGAVAHAAGAIIQGKAFIFAGRSGAGKTTLSRQVAAHSEAPLLSDDRVALRNVHGSFLAYGTPWSGEQGAALNERAELGGIFFLRHAASDEVVDLSAGEAVERLLPVLSVPWYDRAAVSNLLGFCDELLRSTPAFELRFRPEPDVTRLLERVAAQSD